MEVAVYSTETWFVATGQQVLVAHRTVTVGMVLCIAKLGVKVGLVQTPHSQPMEPVDLSTVILFVVTGQPVVAAQLAATVETPPITAVLDVKVDLVLMDLQRLMALAVHRTETQFAAIGQVVVVVQLMGTVGIPPITAALDVKVDLARALPSLLYPQRQLPVQPVVLQQALPVSIRPPLPTLAQAELVIFTSIPPVIRIISPVPSFTKGQTSRVRT